MISQSGTLYKIIVTSCILLGVNKLSLSSGSPIATNLAAPPSLSHALYNLHYPPTGTGVYFTAGDIAAAESGSLFGDGAIASHPLHSLMPGDGMDLLNVGTGGNQFLRTIVAPQEANANDLQTAGQSYFIEPPTPTTTTQKPTFKKRKTRRPISSLAEKSKKAKEAAAAAESDNSANNEVFQGNPVPFNPFRQIVNTSFGRKRPSDNRQERPRSRPANVANQETGSGGDGQKNYQQNIDSLNEIPKNEGEPRTASRRRPAQDLRPVRPTTTVANEDSNLDEPPKGRRHPLRKPRPSFDAPATSGDEGAGNANLKPLRPRNFAKRPRPRPTTTIAAPATETDYPIETTYPVTVNRPVSTFTPQPTADARPRVRPARPLTVGRFTNANRNIVTTTIPSYVDSTDEIPVPSPPPVYSPRRRPLRPTTRQQSLTTSTEAPEDILKNHVSEVSSAPESSRARGDGAPRPFREDRFSQRPGFVLRPRPTPTENDSTNTEGHVAQNEVGLRKPLSNRRRKRPTTTVASPASPAVSYNQAFTGGVVENNLIPSGPPRERGAPGSRRGPQGFRTRQTPLPLLPSGGEPNAYQVRDEQPAPQPILNQPENVRNPTGPFLSIQQGTVSPISGPSLFRRPTGPSAPSAIAPNSPIQQPYNNNAGLVDPNNFVNPGLLQLPQDNFGFYPGLDNVLGVPSNANFRSIKQSPSASEFSSRSTGSSEPEIAYNDFTPAASTERQSVSPANSNADTSPAAISDITLENKQETEQSTKAPSAKLSPLERLQQNRQAAARRLLAPRKPTEKPTVAPIPVNQKIGKNFRKSIIPPRMLRSRGKLPGQQQEQPIPDDGRENDSGAVEEKPSNNNEGNGTVPEIINDSTSAAAETDKESNSIAISPNPKPVENEASTRKPSILEAAKRRRANAVIPKNDVSSPQPQQPKLKITPSPPVNHDPEAPPPTCEDGQRYSKFLKRCVTMYKPKAQG